MFDTNRSYIETADAVIAYGGGVNPRGQGTVEVIGHQTAVNMRKPIITLPSRALNYQFMFAEAAWILRGDDSLAPLVKHINRMKDFSDDGETLSGAYGPRYVDQRDYVLDALLSDPTTRQAGLTLWKPSPTPSKDIPCTLALWFLIREGHLWVHAFMRSSDVWLGLPYDIFSFSMIGHDICARYNLNNGGETIKPGGLIISAASTHVYDRDADLVKNMVKESTEYRNRPLQLETPSALHTDPMFLMHWLEDTSNDPEAARNCWKVDGI